MTLVADLRLRFGAVRLPTRLYLPSPSAVAPDGAVLMLWLASKDAGDALCAGLCAVASAVVLDVAPCEAPGDGGYGMAALEWAAEHAGELGADPGQLIVGGQRAGAERAAQLAVQARDSGWPALRRQALVLPAFTADPIARSHLAGTAPATIVTTGARQDAASRYAAALREAGVEVRELVSDARRALPLHDLARAL